MSFTLSASGRESALRVPACCTKISPYPPPVNVWFSARLFDLVSSLLFHVCLCLVFSLGGTTESVPVPLPYTTCLSVFKTPAQFSPEASEESEAPQHS
jgi:hypothetical protein